MKIKSIVLLAAGVAAVGAVAVRAATSDIEQPDYRVVSSEGDFEIREYEPMIVAQATVVGERRKAMNDGFRIIADYIFGNNLSSQEVAMTAPVTQQASEKIAMTSPVTQQASGTGTENSWQVRFVMPSEYTMDTLPKPKNMAVTLLEVPAKRVAAIRYSGNAQQSDVDKHREKLMAFLSAEKLTAANDPTYAFYDAPWTPGFMRRNEVMVEIES
ncbi:heme-binding protein [Altererythrobacter sp. ZODW24]|uniref:SOUL family heme-binding protein n=1 Tax=Altererythrobacter sp. ZODW24 TaxID=2185142 RepID=UPI000DF7CCBD|nr:heme-binding protein [Altererythrobacter sp. ZODW24]